MSRNTWIIGAIAIAYIAAGVALGFAHWDPVAIIGFLTGLGAVITPLIVTMVEGGKTHRIVNSQRSDDTAYRKVLADTLRAHGIVVPDDATGSSE